MRLNTTLRFTVFSALAASASLMALPAQAQLHGAPGYNNHAVAPVHHGTDPVFRVDLNKTQIVRLPVAAGSIVVGNPLIADISVHSQDMIFVVGRGYGETNLLVLDREGRTVMDADIQVTSVTPSHGVRVFNASQRRSYSCAPYCQPSPILGDDAAFIGANSAAEEETSGLASLFDGLIPSGSTAGTSGTPAPQGNTGPSAGF